MKLFVIREVLATFLLSAAWTDGPRLHTAYEPKRGPRPQPKLRDSVGRVRGQRSAPLTRLRRYELNQKLFCTHRDPQGTLRVVHRLGATRPTPVASTRRNRPCRQTGHGLCFAATFTTRPSLTKSAGGSSIIASRILMVVVV